MRWLPLVLTLVVPAVVRAELLKPGDAFPSWSLVDQTGATVTSKDLAGKTYLLWFYPKAMTPGCTAEGQGLRDRADDFAKRGVVILGVSFDTPADNAAFVAKEHFPFRLLSDGERKLATATGAASSPTAAVASRISYLVGPDGKVQRAYGTVDPRTHAASVLGDLP